MSKRFWKTADSAPPLDHPEHRVARDVFGGGGGTTTTVQKSDPWSGVQPFLMDLFNRAQTQSNAPGIAPQSAATQQAIQQQIGMAGDPNSLISQSQRELGRTISGQYLNIDSNPAAQAAIDAARRTVNSQFSGDNYGGSAHQEWMARGATSAAAPFMAQERQNQLNAMQVAPWMQTQNTGLLASAGAAQDTRAQAEVDAPWQNLFNFQRLLGSGSGYGTTSMEQPYFTNPLGGLLGGGLAGYALGGIPGMAIGGLLGAGGSRRY